MPRLASRVLPLLLLAPSACWVPLEEGRVMESRLDKLEADAADQARRIQDQDRVARDRIAQIDQRIAQVDKKLEELNRVARVSGADLRVQVQQIADDLTKVKGDLEADKHDLQQLQPIQSSVTALDQRLEVVERVLRQRGAMDPAEARQKIQALSRPDDPTAILGLARQEEAAGNAGVAREIYGEYVTRFPKDPAAPEAALHAGDLAAGLKRWREAFVSYGWVYKNAPRSEHAPDAMLGMAKAMMEQDDLRPDAPAVLEELVQKHPKSAAAAKAKALLAELQPAKKPKAPRKK